MLKKVIVTVDQDGGTKTDYINFGGATCLAASKQFHALLAQFGIQVEQTSITPKPELLAAGQDQAINLETAHESGKES